MMTQQDDKNLLLDCLKDQKFLAGNYATMATEVACNHLLQDTMKVCQDEININYDIFNLMHQKGWYPLAAAEQKKIQQAQSKAQQLSSTLS